MANNRQVTLQNINKKWSKESFNSGEFKWAKMVNLYLSILKGFNCKGIIRFPMQASNKRVHSIGKKIKSIGGLLTNPCLM